ncbi:MAG: RNA-binding protein [Bdellovibrionales bacterium CG10_big_fil_rev_8_21_14_0_10_45_34]|nr:MAG: RNA-binding protein [Bdellovibrionales bacterium CG10_big_fil_rev_8_21_14_0_10_45_34]
MNAKIYVGNLPYRLSEEELMGHFAQMGEVLSAQIVTDRETGRSKGFGFVEMQSADEAKSAVEKLDGQPLAGRNLKVTEARPREERPRNGGGDGGFKRNFGGRSRD